MREINGTYLCTLCEAVIEMGERELLTIVGGVRGKPTVRIVLVDGREAHRCEVPSRRRVPRRP
jgi:hypothetical protein